LQLCWGKVQTSRFGYFLQCSLQAFNACHNCSMLPQRCQRPQRAANAATMPAIPITLSSKTFYVYCIYSVAVRFSIRVCNVDAIPCTTSTLTNKTFYIDYRIVLTEVECSKYFQFRRTSMQRLRLQRKGLLRANPINHSFRP
jgi:hypothetical protein